MSFSDTIQHFVLFWPILFFFSTSWRRWKNTWEACFTTENWKTWREGMRAILHPSCLCHFVCHFLEELLTYISHTSWIAQFMFHFNSVPCHTAGNECVLMMSETQEANSDVEERSPALLWLQWNKIISSLAVSCLVLFFFLQVLDFCLCQN